MSSTGQSEDEAIRGGVLRFVREAALEFRVLPGELDLAKRLGCSRQQVRRALGDLERAGVVIRRQGAATVVDPLALRMSVRLEEQVDHTELLERMGYHPAVEVVESHYGPFSTGIAAILTPDAQTDAFIVTKRWLADDQSAMLAENTLALPVGAEHTLEPDESIFSLAQRLWGESIVWQVVTPGVTTLDARRSELMQLPVGSAAMTLEVIGVTASGRRVFHAAEIHNPQIVAYTFVRTVQAPWGAPYGADIDLVRPH
ncbi:MAG: GntR family transcriptional regulator [Frondihabitans sp.]|nr:GntR family transcriptional regulator [Frondihabitans sp.]